MCRRRRRTCVGIQRSEGTINGRPRKGASKRGRRTSKGTSKGPVKGLVRRDWYFSQYRPTGKNTCHILHAACVVMQKTCHRSRGNIVACDMETRVTWSLCNIFGFRKRATYQTLRSVRCIFVRYFKGIAQRACAGLIVSPFLAHR